MEIKRGGSETTIKDAFGGFGEAQCYIGHTGNDNSDAEFSLQIRNGGQIEKDCDFKIYGPIERGYLLSFLKQVVYEIELLDKN